MIFSEIYGTYYNTVTEILSEAADNKMRPSDIRRIVEEKAFGESILTIPSELSADGAWPLLDGEGYSILNNKPTTPVSRLQKRWLKALLSDPRIRLFSPDESGLEDIEPLFTPDMIVKFDRCDGGDPYEDENYIECFKNIVKAIDERAMVNISFTSDNGNGMNKTCVPVYIEYSGKNDRFRVVGKSKGATVIFNMTKINKVEIIRGLTEDISDIEIEKKSVVMLLKDERQALDRAMLHFSDYEKVTEQLEEDKYRITLRYDKGEENEMLIRVLMFGPMIKVTGPPEFLDKLLIRLKKQLSIVKPR